MKKLINDQRAVVPEMLEGLVRLHPDLALPPHSHVVTRAGAPGRGVALISGGGGGHEPAHAGFVGAGLLHAAVSGNVFTSPSTDAVLVTIRAVAGPNGVLLIVKNYTGDRPNFGLTAEMARAEGTPADLVRASRPRRWPRSRRSAPWAWPSRPAPYRRPARPALV